MRLEPLNAYEVSITTTASRAVQTGAVVAGMFAGVYGVVEYGGVTLGYTSAAIGISAAAVGVAYIVPAWLAWVRHLGAEADMRDAEAQPGNVATRLEIELTEKRIELMREIAAMPAPQFEYARRLLEAGALFVDGRWLKWRMDGREYPAHYAAIWWEAHQEAGGEIPADGAWQAGKWAIGREDWRQLASAVAEALVRQGVAQRTSSQYPARWLPGVGDERRQDALSKTGVAIAATVWAAVEASEG